MHNVRAYTFWFFAVLHQRLYNIKWTACNFLYIIFAVLLKFERSLNSYFVHNNNYYYYLPATSLQNFIYLCQSPAEILLFVRKSKMAAAAILNLIFVQYFGILACRTSRVIHMPNFVQICAIVNELWKINEIQNGGRRDLEFIILSLIHISEPTRPY